MNKTYTPGEYLEAVTGRRYDQKLTAEETAAILEAHGLENLWDYPVEEADHIAENDIVAVLVNCADGPRWFEFPEV